MCVFVGWWVWNRVVKGKQETGRNDASLCVYVCEFMFVCVFDKC